MNRPPVIVGLGEVLWDVYPDGAHFGGAPANFACHSASLGADAWMVSAVGTDALGDRALAAAAVPHCARHRVGPHRVDRRARGYLAPLEDRYQLKLLADYPMFPGGGLLKGEANPEGKNVGSPAGRDALLTWFREMEQAAGVTQQPGRGWYGLRRRAATMAPSRTNNTAVLSTYSGTSAAMLEGVYRDKQD